ncbi:hypothetical protein [Bacillus paranthracis]|uniref:hypothetical protein n=1 Tax=Bacillus paranthracis TaxID=2026186 RepID=UPI0022E4DAF9|nr:hypothetical protein [Bacillus paranthracis]
MRDNIEVRPYLQVGVRRFYEGDKVKVVDVIGNSWVGKLTSITDDGILISDGWGVVVLYSNIKRINHVRLGD